MADPALEVLLVDEQLAIRHGTELMLREAGCRVVGLGSSGAEAAGLLTRRGCDIALVDSVLDGEPSAPLLARACAQRPDLRVVVHAGRDATALQEAVTVGVPGLVMRSSSPAVLLEALRTVAAGGRFVDPEVTRRLPGPGARPVRRGIAQLSPREREILGLLARGRSGAEIAGDLYLSSETVRTHVRNAVNKLGARTRTQAVALLVDHEGGLPVDLHPGGSGGPRRAGGPVPALASGPYDLQRP